MEYLGNNALISPLTNQEPSNRRKFAEASPSQAGVAPDDATLKGLLDLPAELRLHIFNHIEDSDAPRAVTIAQNVIHRLDANGCPTLAALSRTCKPLHQEVADLLYRYRTFHVDILGSDSLMALWRRNMNRDLLFLNRMQKVHLTVSINTGTSKLGWVFDLMENVLKALTGSSDLNVFTLEIREIYHFVERRHFVNLRLENLRKDVTREASSAGTSAKDTELDVAWATLGFFRDLLTLIA